MPQWRVWKLRIARPVAAIMVALASAGAAAAQPCGLCAREIVINSELAQCLLGLYPSLSRRSGGSIPVDLTGCERSRGIIEPLPTMGAAPEEPDLRFLLSRGQLDCLKAKLEEPGIVLDPATRIDLGACP